jgi:UDPglucose--hexose-1-phosphate uridylyltransferase
MTPPAVLIYRSVNGEIVKDKDRKGTRHKDWTVRCVPNLFPAFSPPESEFNAGVAMKNDMTGLAVGHHEVLVESPIHDVHPADAQIPQLMNVINAYLDRMGDLAEKPYVKYVSVFRNHGQQAGASLTHAHSQVIAMPFVPPTVEAEIKASAEAFARYGKCVFCNLVEQESTGPRIVHQNSDFIALTPYASIYPMEFWIIPKRHAINPLGLTEAEIEAFAAMLKSTLKALKTLVNDPPYNYGMHIALDANSKSYYHWHLEVFPKLAIWAGFEKSTGVYINTIPPESAALELRKVIGA